MISITTTQLCHWFNAIRNVKQDERDKILDAFWDSQLDSKAWLVNNLNAHIKENACIMIFGGWIGVLSNMLFISNNKIDKILSIDLDEKCAPIAETLNYLYLNKFQAITANMADYSYDNDIPDVAINTSSEHVTQDIYNEWYDKIPIGTLICVQGNDYFSCSEHVRCSQNLVEFKRQNHVYNPIFEGELKNIMYTRYMSIWRK